jgi:hypothetical protein
MMLEPCAARIPGLFRLAALISMAVAMLAGVARADQYLTYTGTAKDLRSQAYLYGERHVMVFRDARLAERVVLYTCRDGSAFARKTVSYVDLLAPNFDLTDASNGLREGVRSEGGQRTVFYRAVGQAEKTSALPSVHGLVVDAGFDEFVRANWRYLTRYKSLPIQFLVPGRLTDMGFRIEALRSDQVRRMPVEVFRLKLAGVLGWVVPGIDVYYDTAEQVLVRYVGLSDLRDTAGENLQVDIDFDPNYRKMAGPNAVAQALEARLAPCK